MAKALLSAAPPYAVTMWMDRTHLYMEIPATNGPPYIATYALNEGGLSKALSMMRDVWVANLPIEGDYTIPFNPMIKKVEINDFSQDQRAAAREVLRKMGITS